jgi:hypothetical protein
MDLLDDRIEQLHPIGGSLLVHHRLRSFDVLDPGETVIVPAIADSRLIHLAGQPLPAVEVDVN